MENAVKSFLKQKRKRVTTKLTTSKKCKHYHKSQLIRNEQLLEQHLSTDSSETENPDTTESEVKTLLFPQNINPFNTYYFPLPTETKEKCTQCTIKTKNSVIQTCPNVRSKSSQTVNTRKLTSTLVHKLHSTLENQYLKNNC